MKVHQMRTQQSCFIQSTLYRPVPLFFPGHLSLHRLWSSASSAAADLFDASTCACARDKVRAWGREERARAHARQTESAENERDGERERERASERAREREREREKERE